MVSCPICGSDGAKDLRNKQRAFHRCAQCRFAWAAAESRPDAETARKRYALHRNDPTDSRYVAFLTGIADSAIAACPRAPRTVLDWGSGPTPVLSCVLRERRLYEVSSWDPNFAPLPVPERSAFDLVLCVEVAEHFTEPPRDFAELACRLRPGGIAAVRTLLAPDDDSAFLSWWYARDPTHVSFYSEASLRFLARCSSLLTLQVSGGSLAIFRRPFPVLVLSVASLCPLTIGDAASSDGGAVGDMLASLGLSATAVSIGSPEETRAELECGIASFRSDSEVGISVALVNGMRAIDDGDNCDYALALIRRHGGIHSWLFESLPRELPAPAGVGVVSVAELLRRARKAAESEENLRGALDCALANSGAFVAGALRELVLQSDPLRSSFAGIAAVAIPPRDLTATAIECYLVRHNKLR